MIRLLLIFCLLFLLFLSYHYRNLNWLLVGVEAGGVLFFIRPSSIDLLFLLNKFLRFIINDLLTVGLIHLIFKRWIFTRFSIYVLMVSLTTILPLYMLGYLLGYQNVIMAMLHRLTMNPTILLLLIPAFYFQVKKDGEVGS
jgi:exosortase F-associated protein